MMHSTARADEQTGCDIQMLVALAINEAGMANNRRHALLWELL